MEIYHNEWIFQNNITAPANGIAFVCGRCDQVTLFITGDSTSRTVYFEGSDNSENWYAIPAVKLPELTIATSTTGNEESWVLNTTNWISVRARVSAVDGGTVRITGKLIEGNINLINSVSATINGSEIAIPVDLQYSNIPDDQPVPTKVTTSALPTGAATEAKQDDLIAKDFATQTTLADVLAKIISTPATEAKQDTSITSTNNIETLLTNVEGTAFISGERTETVSSADLVNNSHKGIHVVLDVSAIADSPSITLKIEGKDSLSGKYYTILESAAVAGISTNIYRVYPHLTETPNLIVNDIIPKTFRVTMTHSNENSITYSVGYSLV